MISEDNEKRFLLTREGDFGGGQTDTKLSMQSEDMFSYIVDIESQMRVRDR